MRYLIKPQPIQLSSLIREWLRQGHSGKVLMDLRSQTEVRLEPYPSLALAAVPPESRPGCTISVQGKWVLIQCASACRWIEDKVAGFLRSRGLVGQGEDVSDCPRFDRRLVVHAHLVGRPVSEDVRARARAEREVKRALKPRRFRKVIEAVHAAVAQTGGWVVLHRRAIDSAEASDYRDPDYIYELIIELGRAAQLNAGGGLDGAWAEHLGLGANGGHDFVARTSKAAIEMFPDAYHVDYDGKRVCIGAHVRCGVGSGQDLARVYLALPANPGAPLILGHIGSHLPLPKRHK